MRVEGIIWLITLLCTIGQVTRRARMGAVLAFFCVANTCKHKRYNFMIYILFILKTGRLIDTDRSIPLPTSPDLSRRASHFPFPSLFSRLLRCATESRNLYPASPLYLAGRIFHVIPKHAVGKQVRDCVRLIAYRVSGREWGVRGRARAADRDQRGTPKPPGAQVRTYLMHVPQPASGCCGGGCGEEEVLVLLVVIRCWFID